jgi:hypothetical protein
VEVFATDLDAKQQLLEQLAGRLGIEVRYEPMGERRGATPAGGLCRLMSRRVILVDAGAPQAEQVGVLLDALCQLDAEDVFVPPAIRRELARRRR